MNKNILKKIIKEEIAKLEEEIPTSTVGKQPEFTIGAQDLLDSIDEEADDAVIFSNIDHIRKELHRFDTLYKAHLTPVLEKAKELSDLIKTNAQSLPPQVVSDFRTMLMKLDEIRKIKEQLLNKIDSVE